MLATLKYAHVAFTQVHCWKDAYSKTDNTPQSLFFHLGEKCDTNVWFHWETFNYKAPSIRSVVIQNLPQKTFNNILATMSIELY